MRTMTFQSIRQICRACAFFVLASGSPFAWSQAPARTPVESFFQNPAFGGGVLSPNGRHAAFTIAPKDGRTQLMVLDVEKSSAKVVASFPDADVWRFEWVNDSRLVYDVADRQAAAGDVVLGPGLFAVDRDGSNFRQLVSRQQTYVSDTGGIKLMGFQTRLMHATRTKTSDEVFVTEPEFDTHGSLEALNLSRLDTRTGRTARLNRPGKSFSYTLDAKDVPRASVTYDQGRVGVHYLDPADEKWRELASWDNLTGQGFYPEAFAPDGTLYASSRNGRDTTSLYTYDLAQRKISGEPLLSLPGYDYRGGLVMSADRLLGIRYETDAEATAWLDPQMKDVQAKIDAQLPGTTNRVSVALRPELPIFVVHAYSDADPGTFLLYNTQTGKFTGLGAAMRGIDVRQMAHTDQVRYKARDGLEIPAWLTLPRDAKGRKVPMVVLVHGGPWVRGGHWRWHAERQFLASRGYAVLEPEFRGSEGFGFRHFRAGWKQWGMAMQNDVADGARWVIAQGIVDPARICIAGASYGGYATLMGLINDPDLFRCGINWVGVTDLNLMYSVTWSDFSLDSKTYSMPVLLGDREKDAAQLKAMSPLQQADRIKQPLLMAYGGADRRVPIVHGTRFKDAVQKTNPNVEWVEYTEEGHGWALVKNRVDFWTRVEKFLDRNIGAR